MYLADRTLTRIFVDTDSSDPSTAVNGPTVPTISNGASAGEDGSSGGSETGSATACADTDGFAAPSSE
ncbi:hypothetical protein GCM10011579_067920 [Streptomyces albiflavescens]|uniref:Uncharacterized protein n=1 Tax=Streptomyces albiflavescens TaxID=1623582 RepID=A0A918D7J8_9ACTN|nr:hypothetical protein GCM10011579_067920 [Streptomyces albiflavescens]